MMAWILFSLSFAVAVALLFTPGLIVARSLRFPWLSAVGVAPLLSVSFCAILCLLWEKVGLPTTVVTVAGGAFLLACLIAAVSCAWRKRKQAQVEEVSSRSVRVFGYDMPFTVVVIAAYVFVPLVCATVFFLKPMDGPNAFMQAFDNVCHLGTIRSALNANAMDPMGAVGYYLAVDQASAPFVEGTSFYPQMWHMFAVMVIQMTGCSVAMAANVMNVAFSFVVFPMGFCALVYAVFGPDRRKLLLGALGCVVFEAFPWGMLVYGPLYPNTASFSLVPALMAAFLGIVDSRRSGAAFRLKSAVVFLFGIVAAALVQTNAAFTVGVLVAPYCIWRMSQIPSKFAIFRKGRLLWRILFSVLAVAAIVLLWVCFYNAPFLSAMVHVNWPSISGLKQTLFDTVFLGLMRHPAQPLVALLVITGMVRTLRYRQYIWLSFSYLVCCVMYFVCAGTDGVWDSFLTGFWYTDQYRIAGMVALAGMPLFVFGLDGILRRVSQVAESRFPRRPSAALVSSAVAVALVAAVVFFPSIHVGSFELRSAFESYSARVAKLYNAHSFRHLSYKEWQFAEDAMEVVGDNGLIANEPFDGSVYLFGSEDAPVYYKSLRGYGGDRETEQSVLIREHIDELADNEAVQEAVRETGVRYVLQLDKDNAEDQPGRHGGYKEEQWAGIASVDDDTPGFSSVLSKDDMRLYKIDDAYLGE